MVALKARYLHSTIQSTSPADFGKLIARDETSCDPSAALLCHYRQVVNVHLFAFLLELLEFIGRKATDNGTRPEGLLML